MRACDVIIQVSDQAERKLRVSERFECSINGKVKVDIRGFIRFFMEREAKYGSGLRVCVLGLT